ncbi:hypothetical protein AJ79_07487 [Helicocarpus griseus UAMH5409]|uniref:Uncharacterized protein n=1 Tax=Helicocarpus griseus UAMH5409 TaxID=1447875 RepID=A0A2B7X284_9EURO|nr:hypothetical protein AJ79_07487 [Helicocarpus griseus UAMH5409]
MARRYQPSELLQLRESPLVVKPDNLPPLEEWMGPPPDPPLQKKNPNSRDQTTQQDPTNRRSGLFEGRHISRGSEDLILGPPKTSFASASRVFGKSIDATDRSSTKINDTDDQKHDRYNFREKFFKDRDFADRDNDRRDTKPTLANGRRTGREDREDWSGGRPRRTFGPEDSDRRPRRNGDSERWEMRDHREHQEGGHERTPRDKDQGRYPPRRDGQGRGKHDNWFRDGEAQQDVGDAEEEKDKTPVRHREWRRGVHGGGDRDWNRPVKHEQEPEWLDSTDRESSRETHTQADFQRWKERMKAGSAQAAQEEKKEVAPEPVNTESKPKEPAKRLDGEMFGALDPTLMDSGLDKFFGLWGENKQSRDENVAEGVAKKEVLPTRTTKASRFAGIFNSPSETTNREPEPQTIIHTEPVRPASTDADQEGFQRILQMLGGNKSRNATPQLDGSVQQPPPQAQPDYVKSSTTLSSPARESYNRQEYGALNSPRDRPPPGLEALFAAQKPPPKEQPNPNRDTEFLLRLMQQSKISPNSQSNSQPPQPALQSPGGMNLPDMHARAQGLEKQKTPVFLDDPAIANIRRQEPQDPRDPRDQLRRRGTNGPPMSYFDEMGFPPSQSNQTPNSLGGVRPPGPAQPPMGLQRPPGFEQVQPPGWPNQQPQQGGSNQFMLPPGLSQPPNRNMNPNFPSGPPVSVHTGMPPNDRPAYQRNAMGGGPSPFGPPPGMMPPPGYMNMNAPPPSAFPPMPHTPDAMMNMPHGNSAQYSGVPPQGPPQVSSRQSFDMFGPPSADGNLAARAGAGMMGPGPYR